MRQDFAMLAPLFDRWIVTDRAIAAHAPLARPPEEVLPTPVLGGSSFVIDCRRSDDGEVYARIAELEAGT